MLVVANGPFGKSVRESLRREGPVTVLDWGQCDFEEGVAGAGFAIFANWRDCHSEFRHFDTIASELGISWCPIRPAGGTLVIGPLVLAGRSACFDCYQRRYLCHDIDPQRTLARQFAFSRDPEIGAPGFIEPTAQLAAAWALTFAGDPAGNSGRVITIDLFSFAITDARAVRIHGCKRCGNRDRAAGGARFTEHLVPALERILP